jgi:hypothetical protein
VRTRFQRLLALQFKSFLHVPKVEPGQAVKIDAMTLMGEFLAKAEKNKGGQPMQ